MSEQLSFDREIQPIYDELVEYCKDELELGGCFAPDDDPEVYREFVEHGLTASDKMEILELAKDEYEYDLGHSDVEVSLHDESLIRCATVSWIKDTFGINWIPGE